MHLITVNQSRPSHVTHMDKLIFFALLVLSDRVAGIGLPKECGIPVSQGKIVGGVDSGGYQYPWFALLLLKKNAFLPVPICAGTLITALHVLTAAHCFTVTATVDNSNLFNVALGVYDICKTAEATRQIYNVESVAVHEKYQRRGKFYDIALMKLDRRADYTFICLPLYGVDDITEIALLIGFGVTAEDSNFVPCHMLQANVTKFSKKDCANTKLPLEDKREPSVICAGTLTGKIDSCYGDSGGPLQTRTTDGRFVIAGIVSYGYGCATPGAPGIYTNVGSYINWIQNKISILGTENRNRTAPQDVHNHEVQVTIDGTYSGRRGFRRKPNSGVAFPSQGTTPSTPTDGGSPQDVQYFEVKRPVLKGGVVFNDDEKHAERSSPKKNSSVAFPE